MKASIKKRFTAWVREQDPDAEYPPGDANQCALGQFLGRCVTPSNCATLGVPVAVYRAAVHQSPFTFGALASRLSNPTGRG